MNKEELIDGFCKKISDELGSNFDDLIYSVADEKAEELFATWSKNEYKTTLDKLKEEEMQCQLYYDQLQQARKKEETLNEEIIKLQHTIETLVTFKDRK